MEKECVLMDGGTTSARALRTAAHTVWQERTFDILRAHGQQESCAQACANQQLLLSDERCSILEAFEGKVLGKNGAGLAGGQTWRNVWIRMEVDSNSLAKAGEQQRDEESLHRGMVAARRQHA